MICGVSQGFILEIVLLNVNLSDLFLFEYSSELTNFADDTTPYKCGKSYDDVINQCDMTIKKVI